MKYSAARGTNDILPEEMKKWHFIEKVAREIFWHYGFGEVRTPLFEKTELFVRSIGTDTDIVKKEMYSFKDKKGRDLTLRPEGTAGVLRAAIQNNLLVEGQLTKLYYMGPMYRYERPQKGRQREFYQVGAELIGEDNPFFDYECILVVLRILENLKLDLNKIKLSINNIGCPDCRKEYTVSLMKYFKDNIAAMCSDCNRRMNTNIMRVLDCKNEKDRTIIENAPKITEYLCDGCKLSYNKLKDILGTMKIEYDFDPYMVRGLDYYTKNVFEIKYGGLGAQDTLVAGGRYDNLVDELGGPKMSGTGFSIGVERLLLVCEKEGIIKDWDIEGIFAYFALIGDDFMKGRVMMNEAQRAGVPCWCDVPQAKSLKSQLKRADKLHCDYVVIIGEDEIKNKEAILRNMKNGKEEKIAFDNVPGKLEKLHKSQ